MLNQKHVRFKNRGDKLKVLVRDAAWNPIYEKEVNVNDHQALKGLLKDLKNKGIDIIGMIKADMLSGGDGTDWFE